MRRTRPQRLHQTVWQSLQKLSICTPNPSTPRSKPAQKCPHVHTTGAQTVIVRLFPTAPCLESIQTSSKRRTDKQSVLWLHNGIVHHGENRRSTDNVTTSKRSQTHAYPQCDSISTKFENSAAPIFGAGSQATEGSDQRTVPRRLPGEGRGTGRAPGVVILEFGSGYTFVPVLCRTVEL